MTPSEDQALSDEAVALFREVPERFITARDALVARLRDEGRSAEAASVKALRKPTVVAWALDQLVVRDADGLHALLDAGAEVRAAQQAALSSKRGAADRLRASGAARRAAVADLAAVSIAALEEAGRGAGAHFDAIVQALEMCSIDPDAGAALAAGTLERPPVAGAGFGDVFGLTSLEGGLSEGGHIDGGLDEGGAGKADRDQQAAVPARSANPTSSPRARRDDVAELRADVSRGRRERDAAARRARKAKAAADGFAHELEGMRRRLDVVERKHADAASAAAHGELETAKAERALRRSTERLERAESND